MPPVERVWLRWAALVGWMALIFFLSGQSRLPDLIGGWPQFQDIAGHFVAYGVLALLWRWVLAGSGAAHPGRWAFVLTLLYGLSDEFHQSFVPGRYPDAFDILTDLFGASVGLLAFTARTRRNIVK